jgi:hypothetical protein
MAKALIEGTASAEEMAAFDKQRLQARRAGAGARRFLLTMQLRRFESTEENISALDRRMLERLELDTTQHALLMQISTGWSPQF